MSTSIKLFQPLTLGASTLQHRIVLAPLTRMRASSHTLIPSPHAAEYYTQRATSLPGTLLITEATFISPRHGGYDRVPGIYSADQIAAWREITDAVHAKQGFIWCQLWALGRVASGDVLAKAEGGPWRVQGPSAISATGDDGAVPEEMSEADIRATIETYAHAARCAMEAGFDGVEIHGANGYLIDQFWQDVSNQREDGWGGSIDKRARFGLEVTRAVIEAVDGDAQKVGIRLSPWGRFQGMGMKDPVPQFEYVIREVKKLGLAYLHLIESRISGSAADGVYNDNGTEELKHFIDVWGPEKPVILAGGFTPEKAKWVVEEVATGDNVAIAFGRSFISTPDLPYRLKRGIKLNAWNRKTFYTPGPEGYTDYPFREEWRSDSSNSRL